MQSRWFVELEIQERGYRIEGGGLEPWWMARPVDTLGSTKISNQAATEQGRSVISGMEGNSACFYQLKKSLPCAAFHEPYHTPASPLEMLKERA